jgi:hypothetical protein
MNGHQAPSTNVGGVCFGKPLKLLAQRAQGIGLETISRLLLLLLRPELKKLGAGGEAVGSRSRDVQDANPDWTSSVRTDEARRHAVVYTNFGHDF